MSFNVTTMSSNVTTLGCPQSDTLRTPATCSTQSLPGSSLRMSRQGADVGGSRRQASGHSDQWRVGGDGTWEEGHGAQTQHHWTSAWLPP